MTGIYHYDDIVNPHPANYKGLRAVAYSPINYRQKYFSDKSYTDKNGNVDYERQLLDATYWYNKNLKLAKKESEERRRRTIMKRGYEFSSVRNIHFSVGQDIKKGIVYPKHIKIIYRCKRNNQLLASVSRHIDTEGQLISIWRHFVDLKLETECITPRALWRNYYLDQCPKFSQVKKHFKKQLES